MRLTAELILESSTYINAAKDHELDLRGNKIPMIENLGASKDLYDAIDFTDNEIMLIGNFPVLKRLQRLYLGNNRVRRIDAKISQMLPNLNTLTLTNNYLEELVDLEPLRGLRLLEHLVLLGNPVARKKEARSWIIYRFPQIRVFNFVRVRQRERIEAKKMYETESGELTDTAKSILQVAPTNVFEPGEGLVADSAAAAEQNNIEQQKNGEGGAGLSSTFENEETAQLRRKAVEAMNMVRAQNLDKAMRMGNVPGALMDDSSDSE